MSFRVSAPYVAVPIRALDAIEQQLDRDEACTAKAALFALYRIANRERTGTSTKSADYIGTVASVCSDTVGRRVPDLERLGLVRVERARGMKTPNVYNLPEDDTATGGNDTAPCGDVAARTPDLRAVLPKQVTTKTD